MRHHTTRRSHRTCTQRGARLITVDGLVPNPEFDHEPLPDMVLGIALDQRAFGPRQLMVAFAAYDGEFLGLMYADRTDPVDAALECCLQHFDATGHGRHKQVAAVVLCDEPVTDGSVPPEFLAKFVRARTLASTYGVHLVDWIACDDSMFRCARRRTFTPKAEPGWWDAPDPCQGG